MSADLDHTTANAADMSLHTDPTAASTNGPNASLLTAGRCASLETALDAADLAFHVAATNSSSASTGCSTGLLEGTTGISLVLQLSHQLAGLAVLAAQLFVLLERNDSALASASASRRTAASQSSLHTAELALAVHAADLSNLLLRSFTSDPSSLAARRIALARPGHLLELSDDNVLADESLAESAASLAARQTTFQNLLHLL